MRGGLGNGIKNFELTIKYTGIDPDIEAVNFGRNNFEGFSFINGFFPEDVPFQKYDLVLMFALFPQIPDWGNMLLSMGKYAKKFINLTCTVRLSGTTVIDKDISYFYYLDSGERVHQVLHNLYELINFCSIHEMRAKKIHFYGYHVPKSGNNNRCVPNKEQVRGNLLLELFDEDEYPGRIGGLSSEIFEKFGRSVFNPEIDVIIDGNKFEI